MLLGYLEQIHKLMSIIFPLIFIFISFAVLVFLSVRHLSQASLLNVDTIPGIQDKRKKAEIFLRKADEQLSTTKQEWKKMFVPLRRFFTAVQFRFRQYVFKIETELHSFRHEHTNEVATKKIKATEEEIRTIMQNGDYALEQKDYDTAEAAFISVIRIHPKAGAAYIGLGNVYFAQNQFVEAKESYLFANRLDPNNDALMMKLGELCEEKHDVDGAISYYQQAVLINDSISSRFFRLAELLQQEQQYSTAQVAVEQAVELESQNPKYLDKLVECSILVGDKDAAMSTFQQLRMVNPENQKLSVFQDRIAAMK